MSRIYGMVMQAINVIRRPRQQTFTANGNFIVPAGITTVYITATASGNNGTNGGAGTRRTSASVAGKGGNGGNGGNAGQYVEELPVPVTPGESISVTVGTGNTVFKSVTLIKGAGKAGTAGQVTTTPANNNDGGSYGGFGGAGAPGPFSPGEIANIPGGTVSRNILAAGGPGANGPNGNAYGAGGCGASGSAGGNTYDFSGASTENRESLVVATGGQGAPGCLIVRW